MLSFCSQHGRSWPLLPLVFALTACTTVPEDWGRGDAARLAQDRGVVSPGLQVERQRAELLSAPLTPDTAVQLALADNPDLQREMTGLGIAAADLYEAGRLANPVLSVTRLSGDSEGSQLTLGLGFDVVKLLFLPSHRRYAQQEFEAARQRAAAAIVGMATETERAWFEATASARAADIRDLAAKAGAASATLAQRYFDAGNISRGQLALEQAEASSLRLEALSARADAAEARARLNRLLGQRDDAGWSLSAELPDLPMQDPALDQLLEAARSSRLDIAAADAHAQAMADRAGLVRRTRWLDGVEVGVERERDYDGAVNAGPTLSLGLPLFDSGQGRKTRAQAELAAAESELEALRLDAANDVRAAYAKLALARERVGIYRDQLIPQREAVVDSLQREVNYMLAGVFELIVAKRSEYDAYSGYLGALRDYWLARSDLQAAVGRSLRIEAPASPNSPANPPPNPPPSPPLNPPDPSSPAEPAVAPTHDAHDHGETP